MREKWSEPAIRVLMMPRDTNAYGTIFGGGDSVVTVSMDKIVFHEPVYVGDLLSLWTDTLKIGRTSITTRVIVKATRAEDPSQTVTVTEAQVVYVNLDENRRPKPIIGNDE
jgi:acyl-CoA thioesterase YciA